MKKYLILITFCNINFCLAGVGTGMTMVIDKESIGSGAHGTIYESLVRESKDLGNSGRITTSFDPGSITIGGFGGMSTLRPASFGGTFSRSF